MKRRERDALDYFRFDAVGWLTSPAVSCMVPAQEGAFIRLLAYQARTKDCTLPSSDDELAVLSRLKDEWKTLGTFVRQQFEDDTDRPGRIFNKKLRGEWLAAWNGYKSRKKRNLRYRKGDAKKPPQGRLGDDLPLIREGAGEEAGTGEGDEYIPHKKPVPAKPGGAGKPPAAAAWSREACDDWIRRFGGTAPGGQIGKALKPLVTKYGWETVRPAWQSYLSQAEPDYVSAQRFAATYGRWATAEPARAPEPAPQKPRALRERDDRAATPEEIAAAMRGGDR
jgi:hypothetical protein